MLRLLLRNKNGQNTTEYAILIGLVVAGVIAMQTYVKRGLQARFKDEVDDMANQTSALGTTEQYEPYYLESSSTTDVTKNEEILEGTARSPTRRIDVGTTQSTKQTLLAPDNK